MIKYLISKENKTRLNKKAFTIFYLREDFVVSFEENEKNYETEEEIASASTPPALNDYYEDQFEDKTLSDDDIAEREEFFEENKIEEDEKHVSAQDYAYKNILRDNGKPKTKFWSVVSLILSIIGTAVSFCTPYGIIACALSVGAVVLSRRVLGYFDGLSIAAIMLSVFGIVFPIAKLLFDPIFEAIYSV